MNNNNFNKEIGNIWFSTREEAQKAVEKFCLENTTYLVEIKELYHKVYGENKIVPIYCIVIWTAKDLDSTDVMMVNSEGECRFYRIDPLTGKLGLCHLRKGQTFCLFDDDEEEK